MSPHQQSSKFNIFIAIFLLTLILPTQSMPALLNPEHLVEDESEKHANSTIIHEEILDLTEATPEFNFEAPTASLLSIVETDVAQFNVSESISSQTPQTQLNIDNENLTIQIPESWELDSHDFNITSLYKPWDLIDDPNVTLTDTTDPKSPWGFDTDTPYKNKEWGFVPSYTDGKLNKTNP